MKRKRAFDSRGVEGIPFRMIIIMVMLAVALPITFDAMGNWDADRTENGVRAEISRLIVRVKLAYLAGEGNADVVEVNIKEGVTTGIREIKIGDAPGGLPTTITYTMENRQSQTVLVTDPEIPMAEWSPDGGFRACELGAGRSFIRLSTEYDPEFVPVNGLGMFINITGV